VAKTVSHAALAVAFLLFALPSRGQTVAPDLDAVQGRLKAGDTIWVMENMKPEINGRIVDLDSSVWVLETRHGRREIPTKDIMRVRQSLPDSLWNGAVIGGVVGLAPWIAWCASMTESGETCGANAVTGLGAAGAGAVIGLMLDMSKNSRPTIYRRANSRRRGSFLTTSAMVVSPILSPDVKGARLSLLF
jgi:hypothetical protein